jgi:tetratricopeptide (TPR) repeat protein
MDLDSAFEILEIEKSADISEVRAAYRDLAEIWHPVKYTHKPRLAEKAATKMKDIHCAYDAIQEHFRSKASSSKAKPANETESAGEFDYIDCINCGVINRISKNNSNATLKCGHCGKNPRQNETQFESGPKCADDADYSKNTDAESSNKNDSANRKNIQVLRPAFIASIVGFILGFSNARPPGTSDGGKELVNCLALGILYFLTFFVVVAIWQGIRRYFSKPGESVSSKKYNLGFSTPILSMEDAFAAIKWNSWSIFILTGLESLLAISMGNVVGGLVNVALVIGLALMVYHRKSRIAAICLVLLSLAGLIATGHNRFFGGEGGRNMIMAFFILWASVQLVIATFKIHTLENNFGTAKRSNNDAINGGIWGSSNIPIVLSILVGGTILFFAFPELKQRYLSDEEFIGSTPQSQNAATTSTNNQNSSRKKDAFDIVEENEKQNPFAQFDKPANHSSPTVDKAQMDADAWYKLGVGYIQSGQSAKAIDAFQQAVRIKPDYADARDYLKHASSSLGDTSQQSVRINPDDAETWYNRGIFYAKARRSDKAIDAFQQVVRINPDYAKAWINLGVAYTDWERHSDAINAYQQALRINPSDVDALVRLGGSYFYTGNRATALDIAQKLRSLDSEKADDLFKLIMSR